jgi:hypothetical protein
MHRTRSMILIGLSIVVLVVAGCATAPSRLATDYGASYNSAMFNQRLNPEAGENLQPVEGFDGSAARATLEKYRETFATPQPPPTFAISVQ